MYEGKILTSIGKNKKRMKALTEQIHHISDWTWTPSY
jgi:hypothetical protein